MTLADELPIVVTKNVEEEEEKPRPLNKEAEPKEDSEND